MIQQESLQTFVVEWHDVILTVAWNNKMLISHKISWRNKETKFKLALIEIISELIENERNAP